MSMASCAVDYANKRSAHPCKNCTTRRQGYHANCRAYLVAAEERELNRRKILSEASKDYRLNQIAFSGYHAYKSTYKGKAEKPRTGKVGLK